MREFGLRLKRAYIQYRWKWAIKQWLNHNPEPLNKLGKQLNKVNNELRQIRRRKKVL